MDLRAIGMGFAFSLMWSSAFATARILVAAAPPMTVLSLRFLVSGLIAVLIAQALGQSWRLTAAQSRAVLVFGLCQNGLYLGLNFIAMQRVEASLAAIIAASMPLIVAALGWLTRGEKVGPLGMAGLLAGLAGVGLIMGTRLSGGAPLPGVMLCVIGALALALATLVVRGAASGGNLLMIVGLQMLVGSAATGVFALALEPWQVDWSATLVAAFIYQLLVPGLAATLLWFALIDRVGMVRAATFHFLNPFFGVLIAALLLGETIGATDVLGVCIAAAGIWAVQVSRGRAG